MNTGYAAERSPRAMGRTVAGSAPAKDSEAAK